MKYQDLVERYNKIESDIEYALIVAIEKSEETSDHISCLKCLNVNVFDYEELVIWDNRLTFLDKNGMHYGLYSDCTLTDLVDILNKIE